MLKEFIPPIIWTKLAGFCYGWRGNYSSWDEAKKKSLGYDNLQVFEKVKSAALKVKLGEPAYERDSVIFNKVDYSFPLLSSLFLVALKNHDKLNVLDFGGSLGSVYFQNKKFFRTLKEFNWCIIEQKHFVDEGKKNFADEHLHFFYDINTCLMTHNINVALFASSLQYLEQPYVYLKEVVSSKIEFIIIDRTPVMLSGGDRITVQKVQKKIYNASYPCRIMSEKNLLSFFMGENYRIIYDYACADRINIKGAAFKGYFFSNAI